MCNEQATDMHSYSNHVRCSHLSKNHYPKFFTVMFVFILFSVVQMGMLGSSDAFQIGIPTIPLRPSQAMRNLAELAIWETLGITHSFEDDAASAPDKKPDYETEVTFRLFTRKDNSVGQIIQSNSENLLASPLDPNIPTKIFIYGFIEQQRDEAVQMIKRSYLEYGEYNVIIVDWPMLSEEPNYLTARSHTAGVANRTAQLLNALAQSKICLPKKQHVIGHSIAAHIAGIAGAAAKVRPGRITGLDPARTLFEFSQDEGRLDKTDADLVDVIHTSAGLWGLPGPIGHVDFYANGGVWPQVDCISDVTGACSHCRAIHFFAHSISNPSAFIGTRCQYHGVIRGVCPKTNATAIMGENVVFGTPGIYYLNAALPHGKSLQTC